MTMAAQLMAGGADQQLIAAKLNETHEISPSATVSSIKNMSESDGAVDMPIEVDELPEPTVAPAADPGMLRVSHEEEEEVIPPSSTLPPEEEIGDAIETPVVEQTSTLPSEEAQEPLLGGTLNATTDQAAEDNRRAQEDTKNKTILSHSYLVGSEPDVGSAMNSAAQAASSQPNIDIFANSPAAPEEPSQPEVSTLAPKVEEPSTPAPQDVISTLPPTNPFPIGVEPDSRDNDEARLAVESAFGTQLPVQPAIDLPMPPNLPVPEFSTLPPQETPFDFSAASLAATPGSISEQPAVDDPAQFRIPGQ